MKVSHISVSVVLFLLFTPLFSAEFSPIWQIGDNIWEKNPLPTFKEEIVANYTAKFFANALVLPVSVIVSPVYYGANIGRLKHTSYAETLLIGYWISYSIIGFPLAIVEDSIVNLPIKIFDRVFLLRRVSSD